MSSGETAQDLVDQLGEAGGWPEPRLLEEILAMGSEAVEPLRALLRREFAEVKDGEATAAASFAVELLGSLTDPATIPDLIDAFRHFDDIDIFESLRSVLYPSGLAIIAPLIEVARDLTLRNYPRTMAIRTAIEAAGADPDARAAVAEVVRGLLADCLSRGPGNRASDDDIEMSSFLVNDLADLADPLARELIERAYQLDMIAEYLINREDVEQAYREGGCKAPGPPDPWLSAYQRQYDEHQEWLRRKEKPQPEPPARRSPPPTRQSEPRAQLSLPQTPIRKTAARPGRNDPCWCGSGKKYKQCHLRQDQAAG